MNAAMIFLNSPHACDIEYVYPVSVFALERLCPRKDYVLIDWGIPGAMGRYTVHDYLRFLQKARTRVRGLIYAVVPDVLGSAERTREYFLKYAPAVRRYADFVVYVAQEYKVFDDIDADFIGMPMRVPCRENSRMCLYNAEALIRKIGWRKIHLLGPPKPALCKLARRGVRVHSLDTAVLYTPKWARRLGCHAVARDVRCTEYALNDYFTC